MTQNFLMSQLKRETDQKDLIIKSLLAAVRQMVTDHGIGSETRQLAKKALEEMHRSGLYPGE